MDEAKQRQQRHLERLDKLAKYRELVALIARMQQETEIEGGMNSEDAISTLNDLIASARKVSGIDPQHPQFCTDCLQRPQTEHSTLCAECEK